MKKQTVKHSKPFYEKWWFWLIVIVLGIVISPQNQNQNNDDTEIIETVNAVDETTDLQERSLPLLANESQTAKQLSDYSADEPIDTAPIDAAPIATTDNEIADNNKETVIDDLPDSAPPTDVKETPEESTASNSSDDTKSTNSTPNVQVSEAESNDSSETHNNSENFNTYNTPEQQQTEDTYVLNTSTMKIHRPNCSSVPKIKPENYATYSGSLSDLLSQGYTTCGKEKW